jgi:hypothetical protein
LRDAVLRLRSWFAIILLIARGFWLQLRFSKDTITKQYVVDALIENIEKSLARRPIEVGPGYVYRVDAANAAIKLAGSEIGMFADKAEVTHRHQELDDLSDAELVRQELGEPRTEGCSRIAT